MIEEPECLVEPTLVGAQVPLELEDSPALDGIPGAPGEVGFRLR